MCKINLFNPMILFEKNNPSACDVANKIFRLILFS
jgi:hypothetical protein